MKKNILIMIVTPIILFGTDTLRVLDGDVTLQINGAIKTLTKDTQIELDECDTVAFMHGKGKVKIKNFVFSEQTPGKTFKMMCSENYFTQLSGKLFANTETIKFGVSLRGVNKLPSNTELRLSKPVDHTVIVKDHIYFSKEFLVTNVNQLSRKKVQIEVYNQDKSLVYSTNNENQTDALIKLDSSILEKGSQVIIKRLFSSEILLLIHID